MFKFGARAAWEVVETGSECKLTSVGADFSEGKETHVASQIFSCEKFYVFVNDKNLMVPTVSNIFFSFFPENGCRLNVSGHPEEIHGSSTRRGGGGGREDEHKQWRR